MCTLSDGAPADVQDRLKTLDCGFDVVAEPTSSRDVDTAKPEPGIARVAMDRAGAVHRSVERRHLPRGIAGGGRVTDLR